MALEIKNIDYLAELVARLPDLAPLKTPIMQTVDAICTSYKQGGKVLVCGNGGSAADSEHIVGELMKGFMLPRPLPAVDAEKLKKVGGDEFARHLQCGVPAIALTGHISLTTAVMNDTDPSLTFAQQTYVLGKAGDVFIGISTSGNASNVISAARVARAFGLTVIGMTGCKPSKLEALCDIVIKAPQECTHLIQEMHLPIYHTICQMVEEQLFGSRNG